MHKKFEINRTKIKGGCQLGRKAVPHDSSSDLSLVYERFDQDPGFTSATAMAACSAAAHSVASGGAQGQRSPFPLSRLHCVYELDSVTRETR